MPWYDFVFELIDMRSFSNLWYWLALAIFWSTSSHWVLGVPHDMIRRAYSDPLVLADVETLVRIYCRRLIYVMERGELWVVWFAALLLTTLFLLSARYGIEFAQAVFCIVLPMTIVFALSLHRARAIMANGVQGPDLLTALRLHRTTIQLIGMVSLFATSVFGMYQNMMIGVLG